MTEKCAILKKCDILVVLKGYQVPSSIKDVEGR